MEEAKTEKNLKISRKMDPKIWSKLPEDVLEHVLSFLPLKTFLSLTSTCKHFKTLIFSPSFVSKFTSSSSSQFSSFLLLSHPQFHCKSPLFDTNHNSWRNLPLPFSPTLSSASSSTLLCISNGHLCFSNPNLSSFIICNILAKSSRTVKFPKWPPSYELLNFVSEPKGYNYKLFMLSSFGPSSIAFVYDSKVHLWRQFEGLNHALHHHEGVFFNGLLYFITPEPFCVEFFHLENGKWGRLGIELPAGLVFARLVSDGHKKLFLIGGIGYNGIARSMKLWELNEDGNFWVEIGRIPELMIRKFVSVCYHKYEHVYSFWHQDLICICCYNWPEILYYKVCRRTWHWLPKCPLLPEKWSCGFRWFSFVPQLYAFA
ncbi:hypothetical protein M9H77_32377 [Catharanthus roseus]|uniref:Uncharacterized protein n=1 Tax=Catharanthus roseus TaxID=4058 RepID=A0ACC0A4L7_CATRO|nr:hypothetical protein M9H77_32377 [Catharanthus roseus]